MKNLTTILITTLFITTFGFAQGLAITEIMQNPSAVNDSDGEWFEIFNSGDIELDLNGWTIKDADTDNHTISSSLIINPGEYKVLSINSNSSTNGGLTVDYQYSDVTLANGADELVLINTNDTVFDSVVYDGGPDAGGTFPDPTGASMALQSPELDNNVSSNWTESTLQFGDGDYGTPGMPNYMSNIELDTSFVNFDTVNVNATDFTVSELLNALGADSGSAEFEQTALMLSAIWDWDPAPGRYFDNQTETLRPYIGLGIGQVESDVSVDFTLDGTSYSISDSEWDAAYQAIAGFRVDLSPTSDLQIGYRYLNVDTDYGNVISHTISVGFGIKF